MSGENGYAVQMMVKVYCRDTNVVLVEPEYFEAVVHPPPWTHDDPAILVMHLELAGKLKYYYHVCKKMKEGGIEFRACLNRNWSVRGTLAQYEEINHTK
jgi:hypothetical protein